MLLRLASDAINDKSEELLLEIFSLFISKYFFIKLLVFLLLIDSILKESDIFFKFFFLNFLFIEWNENKFLPKSSEYFEIVSIVIE